jgi:heat shock protein HslJ
MLMERDARNVTGASAALAILLSAALLASSGAPDARAAARPERQAAAPGPRGGAGRAAVPASPLANTEWRLREIQSMDDAVGSVRPDDPSLYTMRLNADGTVAMRLNCNRAAGTWKAEPGPGGSSGRFEFGPLAATRASCPPPSLDERVSGQAQYFRSYILKDGRLHLSLMADGGIYVWELQTEVPFETKPDNDLEAAILEASPSYTRQAFDLAGAAGRGRYVYGRVDLNGDGRDEVFVYLLGSFFCGSGGCNLLLFTPARNGYTLVNEFTISRLPVIVSPRTTTGWHDVFRLESGGGAKASYVRHAFDGRQYVERGRTPAVQPPEGKRYLAGELAFDKAIPLEPRSDKAAPVRGPSAPAPSQTGFPTVCGVSVSGKEYRYRCTVEGAAPGASGKTVLHFPDNAVTIAWLGSGKATATFAGMNPQGITVSTSGGVTTFAFENKVYFYASDRSVAAAQLKALR